MGRNRCIVLFCKSRGSVPGINYFRLTAARHDMWLRALGRDPIIEQLTDGNRICSLHFAEEDIIIDPSRLPGRPYIKAGAVPTKLLGPRRPAAVPQDEALNASSRTNQEQDKDVNADQSIPLFEYVKIEPPEEETLSGWETTEDNADLTEANYEEKCISNQNPLLLDSVAMETIVEEEKLNKWKVSEGEVDLMDVEASMSSDCNDQEKLETYTPHQCHRCEYQTNYKSNLTRHLLKHVAADEAKGLNQSDYETIQKSELEEYLLHRHRNPEKIVKFLCDKCDYKTIRKDHFQRHLLRHQRIEDGEFLKCGQCSYQTLHREALARHLHRHRDPETVDRFKCVKCDFQTEYRGNLKAHLVQHQDPQEVEAYKCDQCEYRTIQKRYMKRHLLRHQNPAEVDTFACDQCHYKTVEKRYLKRHVTRHKRVRRSALKEHRNPDNKSTGDDHVHVHGEAEGDDFLKCDKCSFKILHKSALNRHLHRHRRPEGEGVNIHKCDKCEYKTIYKNSIKHHLLRHKNPDEVDRFECDRCDYKTIDRSNFNRHLLQHRRTEGDCDSVP